MLDNISTQVSSGQHSGHTQYRRTKKNKGDRQRQWQDDHLEVSGVVNAVTTPNTEEQRRTRETDRDHDRMII